jgi:transposase
VAGPGTDPAFGGGHARLDEITCHGDAYLRTLLIQGARSSLQRAKAVATEKATPEQR